MGRRLELSKIAAEPLQFGVDPLVVSELSIPRGSYKAGIRKDAHVPSRGRRCDTKLFREERATHAQLVNIAMRLIGEMLPWLLEPAHDGESARVGKCTDTGYVVHKSCRF